MIDATAQPTHYLLVCTVGGTPEPLVKSLQHWNPARVIFVTSDQTRAQADLVLREFNNATQRPLNPGQVEFKPVPDAEDLTSCVQALRSLEGEALEWTARPGGCHSLIVDFTAGTKCMTAALALVARRWPCLFSYVGGLRRTKAGVGFVEAGSERVIQSANPWDALGYQAVEDAIAVFNQGGYAAAAHLLDSARKNAAAPEVKRELSTLQAVMHAYAAWDRFDHNTAVKRFDDALKNQNDLNAIFQHNGLSLIDRLRSHRDRADFLAKQSEPTVEWIIDLLHNADRRAEEGRYDDGVARLYRSYEALAQVRLRESRGVADTKAVPIARLPESIRGAWAARAKGGVLMLGLQDAWRLLKELGDEAGNRYAKLGFENSASPLSARNQSILAHGFQPVGEKVYNELRAKLVELLPLNLSTPVKSWTLPLAPSGSPPGRAER